MRISATNNFAGLQKVVDGKVALPPAALRPAGTHFSDVLKLNDFRTDRAAQTTEQVAHRKAQEFVAITLVQPVLEQARRDPFRTKLFYGGFAEDVFAQQLDSILADRITQRANFPVVEAVYRKIMAGAKGAIANAPRDPGLKPSA